MKPILKVSRSTWALLVVSTMAAGAVFALPRVQPLRTTTTDELIALRLERDGLTSNSDEAVAALQREAAGQNEHAWTEAMFAAWVIAQSPAWKLESQSIEGTRLIRMSRVAVRLNEWPLVRAALRQWAEAPGISVAALDLEASGRGSARLFNRIVVDLRIQLSPAIGNPQRAGPGPGALPVAAAGAGKSREIGTGPSLRASRPDHPDPSTRLVPLLTNPTKQP